jgi:secreted Zn-dependent insulinase-like peptidase
LKGFFYEPLFAPAAVSRELNAVDSEFRSNLLKDYRRLDQLLKHTRADPRHPNSMVSACAQPLQTLRATFSCVCHNARVLKV